MQYRIKCFLMTQVLTTSPYLLPAISLRLLSIICLTSLLIASSGCQPEPHGPAWELAKIRGEVHRDDLDPLGAGYSVNLGERLITDRDIEYLYLFPAREIISLDLSETKVTNAGLKQLKDLTNLRELKLGTNNVSDEGLQHLAALKELRSLQLEDTQVMGPGLKYLQSLSRLERLNLRGTKLTDNGLAHVRTLGQIKSLDICYTAVSDRGLEHIAELSQLQRLWVGPLITDAGVERLQKLTKLKRLVLKGTSISDSSLQKLRQALPGLEVIGEKVRQGKPPTKNLMQEQAVEEIVRLGGSVMSEKNDSGKTLFSVYLYAPHATGDAVLTLLDSLKPIQNLHLAGGWVRNSSLVHLLPMKHLRSLTLRGDTWRVKEKMRKSWPFGSSYYHGVRDTLVNDDGLQALGQLTQLRSLDLTSTYVTDNGLRYLVPLTQLEELGLRNLVVTGAGLKAFQPLKNLHSLDLTHTVVNDNDLEHLQAFPQLKKLWLGRTLVTDAGIKKFQGLKKLQFLDLNHTAITDSAIIEIGKIKSLTEINLDHTLVTDEGVASLRKAIPMLKIVAENIGDRAPRATDAEMEERRRPFH